MFKNIGGLLLTSTVSSAAFCYTTLR